MHNNAFKGILLVCDMDGTLLDSRLGISSENKKAIEYFVGKGGLFTVATGRIERSVEVYLEELPINVPAVLYNGAVIYDFADNKVLWGSCLQEDVEAVVENTAEMFPHLGVEIYHGGNVYLSRHNAYTEKHRRKESYLTFIEMEKGIPKPWYKVIFTDQPDILKDVEPFLKQAKGSFDTVYSEPYFLELLNRGISKGYAIGVLKKILGIDGLKTIALGDGPNDMEMIAMADIGIAVGNAHEALKSKASFCCCCNDEHAIAEVIEWIDKQYAA